jgi:hypothetical protein
MFRRLFIGLMLLVFTGLLPSSCFFKCNLPDYAILREFSFDLSEPNSNMPPFNVPALTSGARTSALELFASMWLRYDYVAAAPVRPLFTQQALAFSCVEDYGSKGVKDPITAVTLTSTSPFNGVVAGQSLNQFARCRNHRNVRDTLEFSVAQLPDSINRWKGDDLGGPVSLRISPKPRDNAQQQFELRIRLQSGKEVVQTTPAIIWE